MKPLLISSATTHEVNMAMAHQPSMVMVVIVVMLCGGRFAIRTHGEPEATVDGVPVTADDGPVDGVSAIHQGWQIIA